MVTVRNYVKWGKIMPWWIKKLWQDGYTWFLTVECKLGSLPSQIYNCHQNRRQSPREATKSKGGTFLKRNRFWKILFIFSFFILGREVKFSIYIICVLILFVFWHRQKKFQKWVLAVVVTVTKRQCERFGKERLVATRMPRITRTGRILRILRIGRGGA